jgi:predicted 2-oxoglutarate/Fe(II)-dependent dioxygenase YbiX
MLNRRTGTGMGVETATDRPEANPVYWYPDFADASTCRRCQIAMDHGRQEPGEVLAADIVLDRQARRVASIEVDQATLSFVEALLDRAKETLAAHFGLALGVREGPSFLRYEPGAFYGRHRDRGEHRDWPAAARRRVSVVVFLNSSCAAAAHGEFEGGELLILPDDLAGMSAPVEVIPVRGALVAFPSDCIHEVAVVTAGARDVIVDWFYERMPPR